MPRNNGTKKSRDLLGNVRNDIKRVEKEAITVGTAVGHEVEKGLHEIEHLGAGVVRYASTEFHKLVKTVAHLVKSGASASSATGQAKDELSAFA